MLEFFFFFLPQLEIFLEEGHNHLKKVTSLVPGCFSYSILHKQIFLRENMSHSSERGIDLISSSVQLNGDLGYRKHQK